MKRDGNLMPRIAARDNLLLAFFKASRGHRRSLTAQAFVADLDSQLAVMRAGLLDGTVAVGEYVTFPIRDPKPRVIHAPAFRERVLHHALMNVCEPRIERYLIDDTFASRRGKGTLAAVERAEVFVRRHVFVLKLDVRHYFDSIDHGVLLTRLRGLFKDRQVLHLFERIVRSHSVAVGKGLPIGALTSQHFANLYLGVLDHHVKNDLRCRGYVRYMDDVLLFDDDPERLRSWLQHLRDWIGVHCGLQWKPPQLQRCRGGVVFLGFRLSPGRRLLSGARRRRFAKSLRVLARARQRADLDEKVYAERLVSLCSHAEHGQDRAWRRRLLQTMAEQGLPV